MGARGGGKLRAPPQKQGRQQQQSDASWKATPSRPLQCEGTRPQLIQESGTRSDTREVHMVWYNEEMSMEEARLLLPKYNMHHDTNYCGELGSLEETLARALQREFRAKNTIEELKTENEHLIQMVKTKKDQLNCANMMLKLRDEKINQLESQLHKSKQSYEGRLRDLEMKMIQKANGAAALAVSWEKKNKVEFEIIKEGPVPQRMHHSSSCSAQKDDVIEVDNSVVPDTAKSDHGCGWNSTSSINPEEPFETPYIVATNAVVPLALENEVQAKVQEIQSEIPIYAVAITEGNAKSTLWLPVGYASMYLPDTTTSLTLKVEEEEEVWCTKLFVYGRRRCIGRSHWNAFVRDNLLQVGDFCLFELVERTDSGVKMMVHFIRDHQKPLCVH